jgi:hypothetical protein
MDTLLAALGTGAKKGAAAPKTPAASLAKSSAAKGNAKSAAASSSAEEGKTYPPYPAPSMAQVRRAVATSCILPLGTHQLAAK